MSDNDLCPMAAILAYVACRGTEGGCFFKFQDGLLTKDRFIVAVRRALTEAGVDASS